jgi:hypothetical protein
MLIGFIILLLLIGLVLLGKAASKRQEEQAKLHLTAEHQRLQRENPEHPDAKMGFEELFLSRLNELKSVRKRNLGVVLRYGGIGAVSVVVICYILDLTIGRGNGLTFDQIIGLLIIGITIGVIAGSIVVFFKYGSPKLRIKTE